MNALRALGLALAAVAAVGMAVGAVYLVCLLRLWAAAARAADPFDASEPI